MLMKTGTPSIPFLLGHAHSARSKCMLDVDTISLKNIIYKLHEAYNMCATCVDCIPSIFIYTRLVLYAR